jgi:outer membrane protein
MIKTERTHENLIFLFFVGLYPAQQTWNLQQCLDYASTHHPLVKQATVNVSKNENLLRDQKECCCLLLKRE